MADTVIKKDFGLFDPALVGPAIRMSFVKLKPAILAKNPVMFVTGVVALLSTVYTICPGQKQYRQHRRAGADQRVAMVHRPVRQFRRGAGGGARQGPRRQPARRPDGDDGQEAGQFRRPAWVSVPSTSLKLGDIILCETGDMIPADGEVIEGIASINESAITGESAPVIRESGGDRSAVTGGTKIVTDWVKVRVTQKPGESFIDRIIALVEGAQRQKTPNEIALTILLVGMTIIFLFVVGTLAPFARFGGATIPMPYLLALLVTLIPTTIGGLLSAIGIAGMDRLVKANVIAKSGRAVEAAGGCEHAAARQNRHHHVRQPHGERVYRGSRRQP